MGIFGDFICPDCGYRSSEVIEMVQAHVESHEAKQLSAKIFHSLPPSFPCPQCGSTAQSDVGQGVKRMKLVGWIVLGIVIIALVYYLDLLKFTWGG